MSVGAFVLEGFGPTTSVGAFVLLGFSVGSTPTPTPTPTASQISGGGGPGMAGHLRSAKKRREAIEREDAEFQQFLKFITPYLARKRK